MQSKSKSNTNTNLQLIYSQRNMENLNTTKSSYLIHHEEKIQENKCV